MMLKCSARNFPGMTALIYQTKENKLALSVLIKEMAILAMNSNDISKQPSHNGYIKGHLRCDALFIAQIFVCYLMWITCVPRGKI